MDHRAERSEAVVRTEFPVGRIGASRDAGKACRGSSRDRNLSDRTTGKPRQQGPLGRITRKTERRSPRISSSCFSCLSPFFDDSVNSQFSQAPVVYENGLAIANGIFYHSTLAILLSFTAFANHWLSFFRERLKVYLIRRVDCSDR